MQQQPIGVNHQINTLDYTSILEVCFNKILIEKRKLIFQEANNSGIKDNAFFWPARRASETATKLYEKFSSTGEPLVLCISGGLDSQAMLYAFQSAGVPFKAAVMKFKNGLNEHDIGYGVSILRQLNINFDFYEIDIKKFYEDGIFMEYALGGCTGSPQFAAHVWLANQIQGVPVFAGEPWHLVVGKKNDEISPFIPHYKEYCTEIYLRKKGRNCISHFFETSGEWLRDLLNDEKFCHLSRFNDPIYSYRAKFIYYRQLGFPVSMPSGLVKLTGFERLYSLLATENGIDNYFYFNELYRKPLEKIFPPLDKREFQIEGFSGPFWSKLSSK